MTNTMVKEVIEYNVEDRSELSRIQQELKSPKGQYNNFGKYKYRSCEDILEAIKPILNNCELIIDDEIVLIGERYYIKATATLHDGEKKYWSVAYAREPLEKKGMDESQITGSTSSYARKYALNGLLAIDDTKDADTMDNSMEEPKKTVSKGNFSKSYEPLDKDEKDFIKSLDNTPF